MDKAILIDGETCAGLAGRLTTQPLGAVAFDGKAHAVDVFVVGEQMNSAYQTST